MHISGALRVSPVPADYVRGEAHGTRTRGWADRPDRRLGDRRRRLCRSRPTGSPSRSSCCCSRCPCVSEPFRLETKNLHISATFLARRARDDAARPDAGGRARRHDASSSTPLQGPRAVAARRSPTSRPSRSSRSSAACCSRRSAASSAATTTRWRRSCSRVLVVFLVDERPQLPADRDRHRGRRRAAGPPAASEDDLPARSRPSSWRWACSPPASPSPTSGRTSRVVGAARGRRAHLPVPAPHRRSTHSTARRSSRAVPASSPRSRSAC